MAMFLNVIHTQSLPHQKLSLVSNKDVVLLSLNVSSDHKKGTEVDKKCTKKNIHSVIHSELESM